MTAAGVILLLLGIAAFAASYFIPDKDKTDDKKDLERKREQIRKLIDSEIDGMKLRVNEATNESVEYSMDKSERALEKITNDKIMAVSEYATTVMEEIDRNHKEVLFLYDMLNDKQTDIKNTVRHAEATVKEVENAAKTVSDTAMYAVNVAESVNETVSEAQSAIENAAKSVQNSNQVQVSNQYEQVQPAQNYSMNEIMGSDFFSEGIKASAPTESVFEMAANDDFSGLNAPIIEPVVKAPVEEVKEEELTEFEKLERSTSFNNMSNNNQMILKLNAEGMSVVDIARQLSLGVGEVQLVIDLFK